MRRPEMEKAKEKLEFLRNNNFSSLPFSHIIPSKENYWLNNVENEWEDLLPVATKETMVSQSEQEEAIFKLFSNGVKTNRDDWAYDLSSEDLEAKVRYFLVVYNKDVENLYGKVDAQTISDNVNYSIKWAAELKKDLLAGKKYIFEPHNIATCLYRPYFKQKLYFNTEFNERQYQLRNIFP